MNVATRVSSLLTRYRDLTSSIGRVVRSQTIVVLIQSPLDLIFDIMAHLSYMKHLTLSILTVFSIALALSQMGCASRELLITQIVFRNKNGGLDVCKIDTSKLPAEWVEVDDSSGFDQTVRIQAGHALRILVVPEDGKE